MDERLRILQRRAINDPFAAARLIANRLRTGDIPRKNLRFAAHLGSSIAKEIVEDGLYKIQCYCLRSRSPTYCYRCGGSGEKIVGHGLFESISAVCPNEIPLELIGCWACDCVSRVVEADKQYRHLNNRIVTPVRKWLNTKVIDAELLSLQRSLGRQRRNFNYDSNSRTAPYQELACEALVRATQNGGVSTQFGAAVSHAYHAKNHSRSERDWQINHLISCLLS